MKAIISILSLCILQPLMASRFDAPKDMNVVENICYSETAGEAGFGDLYLPDNAENARPILLIHGGAWKFMDRYRVQRVAEFLCRQGYAVFNIEYRLTAVAPYPACEEDCIAGAQFLLKAGHPAMQALDRSQIIVGGLSAGGHLALMTGLKLPPEQIAGIIDISGPTDLTAPEVRGLIKYGAIFEDRPDIEESLKEWSPTIIAKDKELPPLLVLQAQKDQVVSIQQAYRIIDVWNNAKADLQAYLYDGPGNRGHDIWRKGGEFPELKRDLEMQIVTFLNIFFAK